MFGPFELRRVLGEGAMGRVWLAWDPAAGREVAIKLLRTAVCGPDFHRRFQREIRLLGALDHPHIARLFAAGSVDEPQGEVPYLVMEAVKGINLLAHGRALALGARLELLARLARAVHYAHTRGVIHRDLKPENILVDERGDPKILDFGIAHVVGGEDATAMTRTGELLGTLAYMAPECFAGGAAAVDPRVDVYALGVIAYELIAARRPHPGLNERSMAEAILALSRENPVPLDRAAPQARGDVATVVMKAMARDPGQRYGSAAELAADLERVLAHQPIAARPPSLTYSLGRFVRRHRLASATALLVVLSLGAAAAIATRYALAEAEARRLAELRLAESEAVSGLLQRMLTSADPAQALGRAVTVREVADTAALELLADQRLPREVRRRLQQILAQTYLALGEPERAVPLLEDALAAASDATDAPLRHDLQLDLAHAALIRGDFPTAWAWLGRVPDALDQGDDARALRARWLQGWATTDEGRPAEGARLLDEARREAAARLGPDHPLSLPIGLAHASALGRDNRLDEALALFDELIAEHERRLGADHPQTLNVRNNRLDPLFRAGRFEQAAREARQVLADRERVLGADHPATLTSRQNLAVALIRKGDLAEGTALAQATLPGIQSHFGATHWRSRSLLNAIAYALDDLGRVAEAEAAFRALLDLPPPEDAASRGERLSARNNLAMLLLRDGRPAEALPEFAATTEEAEVALGAEHPWQAIFQGNHGECLLALGRPAEALPRLQLSHRVLFATFGPEHERTRTAASRLERAEAELAQAP